jgi:ABC-type multidrug transport system fused ATPase/permease subunit
MMKFIYRIKEIKNLRENVRIAVTRMTEGRETVKEFGQEAYENERLKTALAAYTEAASDFALKAAFAAAFFILALFLSLTIAVIAAGVALIDGNITEVTAILITVTVFAAFTAVGIFAVLRLIKLWKTPENLKTSAENSQNSTAKTPITYGDLTAATDRNDLNLSGVTLSIDGREIFSGLSFYVKSGEPFAVLGRTGAGKTTFERILRREIIPDAGIITIGGIELADFGEKLLREKLKALDFITSNRVSEVMDREVIILLDGGVAAYCGNHNKLLVASPLYRKMYEAEFGVNPYKSLDNGEDFDDFLQ